MQLSRSLILEVHLVPHGRAIHMARTCRPSMSALRPLPGAKRTLRGHRRMTASDPTETWAAQDFRSAKALFVPSLKRDIVPLLHAHNLRPEGSHGNPHPTARIHVHTGRRSSCVAARGAGAAGGNSGGWIH